MQPPRSQTWPPCVTAAATVTCCDVVGSRSLRRAEVESYLASLQDNRRLRGRYWVSSTSGSSGLKCLVPSTDREWATVIASYARANEWAGVTAGLTRRTTMAVVSSTTPWHQSSRVAATVQSPFMKSARFDAASPLDEIVAGLRLAAARGPGLWRRPFCERQGRAATSARPG